MRHPHARLGLSPRSRPCDHRAGVWEPKNPTQNTCRIDSRCTKRDVLHLNRFDFESIHMQDIFAFQSIALRLSNAYKARIPRRWYLYFTISVISVCMSFSHDEGTCILLSRSSRFGCLGHSSWDGCLEGTSYSSSLLNCSKVRISRRLSFRTRVSFLGLAACRLLAPAHRVLSNGSRGHGGKACAAERGSRDGNGWDNSLAIATTSQARQQHRPTRRRSSVATGRASCMRCSASPAASGDGFRARAGDVLLAGAHAARVRRKQRKPTASGPR